MPSDARRRHSFLSATLVSCILYSSGAIANSVIVDDQHSSLVWDGAWEAFTGQPEAEDGTLTWANRTGATATLAFTGTSVQVFGAFKPVGTWNIQSLYALDSRRPTAFVPSPEVPQEASRQKFYDSGLLPSGQHTLKITNLGVQLWIDYLVYDDGGGSVQSSSSAALSDPTSGDANPPATRPPSSSSAATIATSSFSSRLGGIDSGAISPSTSSGVSTASPEVNATVSLPTPAGVSSVASTLPAESSPLPLPSSSSNEMGTPGGSEAPQPSEASAHGMRRAGLVGIIVGIVVATAVATILAVLLRHRHRNRQRMRTPSEIAVSQYPFSDQRNRDGSRQGHWMRESHSSETLSIGSRSCRKSSGGEDGRAVDGRVSAAGEPLVIADAGADAWTISDAMSEQSTPPPSYKEFEHDAR